MAMECRGSEPAKPLVNSSLEIGPRTMESHLHPRASGSKFRQRATSAGLVSECWAVRWCA